MTLLPVQIFALQMTLISGLVIMAYFKFNKRGGYGVNHENKLKQLRDKKWQGRN